MTIIMNTGRVPKQVGVINTKTGKKATTRVMGRSRGTPATGWEVDPNWMAINGKNIKLVDDSTVTKVVKPIHGKTNSSKVKARMSESAAAAKASAAILAKSPPKAVVAPAVTAAPAVAQVTPVVAKANTAPTVATKGATT
jgi:hypothetical protein